jgi:putative intracellular protease/amidase
LKRKKRWIIIGILGSIVSILGLVFLIGDADVYRTENIVKDAEIAIYSTNSEGCEIIYNLLSSRGYKVKYIYRRDVIENNLKYKLIILPGGSNHVFAAIKYPLFRENIKKYVEEGGNLLAICGGTSVASLVGFCETNWFELMPYYIVYSLTNTKSTVLLKWEKGNIFSFPENSTTEIVWAAGPFIFSGNLKAEATFTADKFLIQMKGKIAIASGRCGKGKLILFGPHPEYSCPYPLGTLENQNLILKAIEWLLKD